MFLFFPGSFPSFPQQSDSMSLFVVFFCCNTNRTLGCWVFDGYYFCCSKTTIKMSRSGFQFSNLFVSHRQNCLLFILTISLLLTKMIVWSGYQVSRMTGFNNSIFKESNDYMVSDSELTLLLYCIILSYSFTFQYNFQIFLRLVGNSYYCHKLLLIASLQTRLDSCYHHMQRALKD